MKYEDFDILMSYLSNAVMELSKQANGGELSYSYALGYLTSDVTCMLSELNLSKEQFKILEEKVGRTVRRVDTV